MKKKLSQNPSFTFLWRLFYVVIQCLWGFPQTFLGLILLLNYHKHPHTFYHGSIRTKWNRFNGISLGLFIFTPNESDPDLLKQRDRKRFEESCERMAVHEYGHTYQSLILGPFYLLAIGLVSFTWARLPRYQNMRKKYGIPYSFCWTEQWANYLGEKILKQPSLK